MSTVAGHDLPPLAETFAELYRSWAPHFDVNDLNDWQSEDQQVVAELAAQLRQSAGVPSSELPESTWSSPSVVRQAYVLLRAIDAVLGLCHPGRSYVGRHDGRLDPQWNPIIGPGERLYRVCLELASHGHFYRGEHGVVVPKWCGPARPGTDIQSVSEAFNHVLWVAPEAPGTRPRITVRRVRHTLDLDAAVGTSEEPLRIAFSPFMYDLEDVHIQVDTETVPGLPNNSSWYTVGPKPERLCHRIDKTIDDLDNSGAHIALLPEGALNDELLKIWTARLANKPRGESPLRWVLVGTGPVYSHNNSMYFNSGVLLHRDSGEELLRHDKFTRFNMDEEHPNKYGLVKQLAPPREPPIHPPLHEAIAISRQSQLLESRAGRFGMLICEDMTRFEEPESLARAIQAFGPSVYLVPVFDRDFQKFCWEQNEAIGITLHQGSVVAVCNSLAVVLGKPPSKSQKKPAFCLLVSPGDRHTWEQNLHGFPEKCCETPVTMVEVEV